MATTQRLLIFLRKLGLKCETQESHLKKLRIFTEKFYDKDNDQLLH